MAKKFLLGFCNKKRENMNSINFTGKTNFCISPTAYGKVEETTRKAYTNLKNGSNCKLSNHKICALETNPNFLTVIVRNNNDGFFKYIPLIGNIQRNLGDLSKNIIRLKSSTSKEPLTAWILGGTRFDSKIGNNVSATLNKIADMICEKPDIDTSILVGSYTGKEKFILRTNTKEFKIALDKSINPQNDLSLELEKIFDVVDLQNTKLYYEK